MSDTKLDRTEHLAPEAVERIALGAGASPVEGEHLGGCALCRREVGEIRTLHARLAALEPLAPSPGFADRVMARVRLPSPAPLRVLEGLRASPSRVLAAAAGALLAVVGTATWLVAYPQVTPGGVAVLLADRGTTLAWQAAVAAARVVYDSGLASLLQAFRADLTPWTAVGGLATLALMGIGSLWVMLRLLDVRPRLRAGTVRRADA
jgi:hypothetical protein